MSHNTKVEQWISQDKKRMKALYVAAEMGLSNWCLAAGFVRNLAWDNMHGYLHPTTLNDIALIYFDESDVTEVRDRHIEARLKSVSDFPWSVKNQARMHKRNIDRPYTSTSDAMSYWVEVETAVGAALDDSGALVLVAPFGVGALFDFTITLNSKRPKPHEFRHRVAEKKWRETWPRLRVIGG
ncbi:nucleotidyltransferase family protein [Vreelandella nanhaiensis]|uniref:Nucleotidyltransferase family protein n=1 Tax=Vreelandella nanhaiensis TaxID=1258546 RepID=A0A3S0W3H4_9GAMM|nr:nucleotidyltransferase family protein [Halomonas nanhaiensis]RUR30540.1 nucleotidyltransferase family protein [Halomonas nanhaiensis]